MTVIAYGKQNKDTALLLHGGGLSWWNYRDAARRPELEQSIAVCPDGERME